MARALRLPARPPERNPGAGARRWVPARRGAKRRRQAKNEPGGEEREMELEKIEAGFRLVLEGLGLDPRHVHLRDTPRRAAEAWLEEICSGLRRKDFSASCYPVEEGFPPGMVALREIPVKSVCAHHLLPFTGQATVAYLPGAMFCGLSTLSRVVDHYARRPQLQENLTGEIARHLDEWLHPKGVGVVIRATHHCMEMRGVNHGGEVTTSSLLGAFRDDPALHAEFLAVLREEQGR